MRTQRVWPWAAAPQGTGAAWHSSSTVFVAVSAFAVGFFCPCLQGLVLLSHTSSTPARLASLVPVYSGGAGATLATQVADLFRTKKAGKTTNSWELVLHGGALTAC